MAEAEFYEVAAKVISQKGHCALGHKVGDKFVIGDKTPSGMCPWGVLCAFSLCLGAAVWWFFPLGRRPRQDRSRLPRPGKPGRFRIEALAEVAC